MSSNWYRTLLFKLTGAEFHEAVFQFVPADETGAKALRNSVLEKAFGYGLAAGAALGRDFEGPRKYKDYMVDIGFVDVVEKTFLVPVNGWPIDPADKEIGNWYCLNFLKFAGAFTKLLEAGGLPTDEIPQFQDQLRYDFTSQHMRVYVPLLVIYGRKPEASGAC